MPVMGGIVGCAPVAKISLWYCKVCVDSLVVAVIVLVG